MNIDECKNSCSNCKWLSCEFSSVCVNSDSEYCADFVSADDSCEFFESKENESKMH